MRVIKASDFFQTHLEQTISVFRQWYLLSIRLSLSQGSTRTHRAMGSVSECSSACQATDVHFVKLDKTCFEWFHGATQSEAVDMDFSTMHLCLVCHAEPDVWDGGYASIDKVLPRFVVALEGIRDHLGTTPRIAWCLTGEVAKNRPRQFKSLLEFGHEIGVHSHFPGETGTLEHSQNLNFANLGRFDLWFPELCRQIVDAGFPPPRTHASWMFAYRDAMTGVLAGAGISVDCSVCYGGAHYLPGGSLLADSIGRSDGKPYRPTETDHCSEGDGPLVEIPVSGGFGSYWEPNRKGGFDYFSPIASDHEKQRQLMLSDERLGSLSPGEVDIFQVHFHLYEFLEPSGISEARLNRAAAMLRSMACDDRVRFSTPTDAARDWLSRIEVQNRRVSDPADHS